MELKKLKRLTSRLLSSISIFALLLTQLVLIVPVANAAVTSVTNVVGTDPDTLINGIDGNDIRVTWTPASVSGGTTFLGYTFYVVAAALPVNTLSDLDALTPFFVNLFPITQSTFNPPPSQTRDSSNNNLANGSYKVCIKTSVSPTNESTVTCSAAFTITGDTIADTSKPFVDFMPVHTINSGASAYLNLEVQDDQTTAQTFDIQAAGSYVKLFYGTTLTASETEDGCSLASGKLFECEITSQQTGAVLQYRFEVKDEAGNTKHVCPGSTSASTAASCKASPFVATAAAAGSRTISGTITGGFPVAAVGDAKIFAGGFGIRAVTTDGSGAYTITGLPNNSSVDIVGHKSGYCTNKRFEVIAAANLTGVDFLLNSGSCTAAAEGSGTSNGKPHIMFSGPPNFANGVPLNETLRVGFDMPLNSSGVNTTDASSGSPKVYLTTDDGTTKIAGSVTYCENQAAAGCSAIPSMDINTIVFDPASDLTANTFYTLVILSTVTGENGQGVEGNSPGGGAQISFTTGGGTLTFTTQTFGTGGNLMPPFVTSTMPGPGGSLPPNGKILVTFNDPMLSSTITTTNVKLIKKSDGSTVTTTVSLDSNEKKAVTISPAAALALGRYEIRVLGAVSSASGITMRGAAQGAEIAFSSELEVKGSTDTTAPTIFPMLANNATGVVLNQGYFQFGFSEPMDPSTFSSSKITVTRGSTSVAADVEYVPGENNVYVTPTTVLAPSTIYTISFAAGMTDFSGVALAATTFTYTTGSTADTTSPKLKEFRADEFNAAICFNEPMTNDNQTGSNYSKSVINHANLTLQKETSPGTFGGTDYIGSGTVVTYDARSFCVKVTNIALATTDRGMKFQFTAADAITDLSGNAITTASGAAILINTLESSAQTFGSFGNEGHMFSNPLVGTGTAVGGEFKPEGFGTFTAEQFGFGQADSAFPFSQTAGADSNVFQTRFTPNVALQDGYLVELTFPVGTGITSAQPDRFSPFFSDMNEFRNGVIEFDATFDTDGVQVDTANRTVTVKLDINGPSVAAGDPMTIDLRKIVNPAIPKDYSSGGYTVGIKIKNGPETLMSKTTMPYFINAGGTNTLNVAIFAGSQSSPTSGATGDIFLHGGGPGGPMDKNVTLTNGSISAIDGTAGTQVQYTSLADGCYFLGTEPFITLGGTDYFGQQAPEPVCLNGGATQTKNIILSSASAAGAAHNITVKLAGIANFGSADMDIFAGGPGRFVVKNLTGVGIPNASGYTISLPSNGTWFVGVGPGMPKGNSASTGAKPKSLPGVPCPPVDIIVSGLGGTSTAAAGFRTPPCASFNATTSTLTFTFATADKTVTGTVTDGSTGLANIEVFMHSQGFGAPVFTTTASDGTFSLSLSDYGLYQIGARKDGLPPIMKPIDIRPDGSDAGTDPDIFFNGKQITGSNALVIKLKKGAYTISGKVLDASSNAISNAPVFAKNTTGDFVDGRTSSDGSYTLFVDNGTWTVKAQLPPDSTATCGTFEATVVVASADMSNQNISPSATTCYTLSGTVSVGGTTQANIPVFIEEWDSTNDRPAGGLFKPTSTNSSGVYSAKVTGSKTYRVGTWSPTYGELSSTYAVATADKTDADLTAATTGTITFAFTGGTSSHEALIEVKSATDKHTRSSKTQKDLSSNVAMTVKAGTYNYFVKVFGVGDFTGSVASGATATIDLSASALFTLSGNVKDSAGSNLTGALVTAINTTTGEIETTTSDSSGNYTMKLAAGTYAISESLAGYVSTAAATNATISASATFNIGGTGGNMTGPTKATSVISGTVTKATANGGGAVTEGAVSATNASGIVITVPINSDGTYQMPVLAGTWTLKAIAPNHVRTTASSTVTVTTADTTLNITLTDDTSSETTVATSKSLSADSGGSVNDDQNTGMRLTAGPGALETGSSDVALTFGRSADAPDTERYDPLGDRTYSVSATGSSSIKELNGRVDLQLNYTDVVAELPTGRTEADLTCAYYSEEAGEYVPVEGGFVVDAANNTITCSTDHFTDFAIVYSSVASSSTTTTTTTTTATSGGGGGGGGGTTVSATPKVEEVKTLAEKVIEEAVEVGASGVIEKEISLQNAETKAYVTIDANTSVTTDDGKKYSGTLPVPTPATVDEDAPADMTYASSVYELGVAGETLKFSKKVKVVLPLKTSAQPGDKLAVYLLEGKAVAVEEGEEAATESVWTKVADVVVKKLDGKYVVEFETDHFSKYVVMEDTTKPADDATTGEADAEVKTVVKTSFADTKGHWAAAFIEDLYGKGIVKGYSGNAFKPDAEITRAEFTKIVITAFNIPILKAAEITFIPFTDVKVSEWYAPYVQAAYIWKIVNGYEDDTFRPNAQINRAEAMKILLVAAKAQLGTPKSAGFKDVSSKDWFATYVNYAAEKGVVSGYSNGNFGPGDNLQRGQVAKIVSLMLKMQAEVEE